MSLHSLRGSSSSTQLAINPVENPNTRLPTEHGASHGSESKIMSTSSTRSMVKDDLFSDGKSRTTHQDGKHVATSYTLEDKIEKPVTMLSNPKQSLGGIIASNAENEARPSSDSLSTAKDNIGRLRGKDSNIPQDPTIIQVMRILLESPQDKWSDTNFPAFCAGAKQPIQVIDDDETRYTLRLSQDVFEYESSDGYACNLQTSDSEDLFYSGSRTKPGKPDIFIPLGWLVRSKGRQHRTTRYVCLWNTSTEPNSLWLAYDYHVYDLAGDCELTNELDPPGYFNCSDWDDSNGSRPGSELEQPSDRSLNIEQHPAQPRDKKIKAGEDDAKVSHTQTESSLGYLGAEDRFDFGMIIHDVSKWNPSEGVKGDQARASLSSTRQHYGNMFRATNVLEST